MVGTHEEFELIQALYIFKQFKDYGKHKLHKIDYVYKGESIKANIVAIKCVSCNRYLNIFKDDLRRVKSL